MLIKDKVINELLKYDIIVEKLGGDVPLVEVSALKKLNLENLIENILILAEVLEIKASITQRSEGTVIRIKKRAR